MARKKMINRIPASEMINIKSAIFSSFSCFKGLEMRIEKKEKQVERTRKKAMIDVNSSI